MDATEPVVSDNRSRSRYEIRIDGEVVGFADYVDDGTTVVLPHTVVDHRHRGKGLAGTLVRRSLNDVRRRGRTVVPQCWYVERFIDEHPEYADLLAGR